MEKKFRYYDPFNGCYSYSDQYGNLALFFLDFGRAEVGENNPVLEQWTGLYDATKWEELTAEQKQNEWIERYNGIPSEWKGIPIYEGDIVKFRHFVGVIIWEGGNLGIDYGNLVNQFRDPKDWKVIGSANSNPELLEKEK
jgi:hypothetical protein